MREIKFRAWFKGDEEDEKPAQMVYSDDEIEKIKRSGYHIGPFGNFDDKKYWDEFELMQYTGLKDKNGKKIYLDDIIYWNEAFYPGPFTGQVILSEGEVGPCKGPNVFEYVLKGSDGRTLHNLWRLEKMEVIGNVHEHPELLKGKE